MKGQADGLTTRAMISKMQSVTSQMDGIFKLESHIQSLKLTFVKKITKNIINSLYIYRDLYQWLTRHIYQV